MWTVIAILSAIILGYAIWMAIRWFKYKEFTREVVSKVKSNLRSSGSLDKALYSHFAQLAENHDLELRESTLKKVTKNLSSLNKHTDPINVAQLYSHFLWRYIFYSGNNLSEAKGVTDKQVLYALESLSIRNSNGHYYIWDDANTDELKDKYPQV